MIIDSFGESLFLILGGGAIVVVLVLLQLIERMHKRTQERLEHIAKDRYDAEVEIARINAGKGLFGGVVPPASAGWERER